MREKRWKFSSGRCFRLFFLALLIPSLISITAIATGNSGNAPPPMQTGGDGMQSANVAQEPMPPPDMSQGAMPMPPPDMSQGGMPMPPPNMPQGAMPMPPPNMPQGAMPMPPPMGNRSVSFAPSPVSADDWPALGGYFLALILGLAFATVYRREGAFFVNRRRGGKSGLRGNREIQKTVSSELNPSDFSFE